jgi:membrane-associated phospholipid phosphatase
MARLTAITALLATIVVVVRSLEFPPADLISPLAVVALLGGLAVFYERVRPAPNFVLCLKALGMLVAFSSVYAVFMYALATTARPLADPWLAAGDRSLGLSADRLIRWVNARPMVEIVLRAAYFSLIPQTILAIVWLGLANDRRRLDRFLLRFMLGALATAVGFYWWPAIGTCASHDIAVPAHYQAIVEHLQALRGGTRTLVSWRDAEGLITFPSFHAIWAILLVSAFYGRRKVFYPLVLLNAVVLLSTVTTGMHYFTDVLVGSAIAVAVILATPFDAAPHEAA